MSVLLARQSNNHMNRFAWRPLLRERDSLKKHLFYLFFSLLLIVPGILIANYETKTFS